MKTPTIYQIKREVEKTEHCFFSRENLKFFNQTLKDYRIKKTNNPNEFLITATTPRATATNQPRTYTGRYLYNSDTKEIKVII